jgi:hypothetical protein
MFAGKAGAYPSEAAPGLALKDYTRLERLAKDKRSSLLQKSVNYGRKSFTLQAPGLKVFS